MKKGIQGVVTTPNRTDNSQDPVNFVFAQTYEPSFEGQNMGDRCTFIYLDDSVISVDGSIDDSIAKQPIFFRYKGVTEEVTEEVDTLSDNNESASMSIGPSNEFCLDGKNISPLIEEFKQKVDKLSK